MKTNAQLENHLKNFLHISYIIDSHFCYHPINLPFQPPIQQPWGLQLHTNIMLIIPKQFILKNKVIY